MNDESKKSEFTFQALREVEGNKFQIIKELEREKQKMLQDLEEMKKMKGVYVHEVKVGKVWFIVISKQFQYYLFIPLLFSSQ